MDQTTATRKLRVLEKLGYIYLEVDVTAQQIKRIQVSDVGISKMDEARPLWEKARREIERILGKNSIEGMLDIFKKLAG